VYDDVIRSEKDGCASHDFSLLTLRLRQNKTFNAKYGEKFEPPLRMPLLQSSPHSGHSSQLAFGAHEKNA